MVKRPTQTHGEETNVVYHFKCPDGACQRRNICYIGLTTTMLKRRMQGHRNSGAIHEHYTETHDRKPEVIELVDNTTIINKESTTSRLKIAEAVSIELRRPTLNVQPQFDLVLPSKRRRPPVQPQERADQRNTAVAATTQATQSSVTPPHAASAEATTATEPQENTRRGGGRRELRNLPRRRYLE